MNEQSISRPPLPDSWVARIFGRMQGLYGSLWLDKWRIGQTLGNGEDIGLANAMRTWAEELAGFAEQPERIKQALDACRSRQMPPNLPEFLEMCRQTHLQARAAIATPKLSQEIVDQRVKEMCATVGKKPDTYDYKKWAKDLRAEYLSGRKLLWIQIHNASGALNEVWKNGQCLPDSAISSGL